MRLFLLLCVPLLLTAQTRGVFETAALGEVAQARAQARQQGRSIEQVGRIGPLID